MMMDNEKGFSIVVIAFTATVTLLSCFNPASSLSIFPHITRSNDAITIDYTNGIGYIPSEDDNAEMTGRQPIPYSSFNPYIALQNQPMLHNPWSYFGRQATPKAAPQCGTGPATLPTAASTIARRNAWPFLVVLRRRDQPAGVYFCSGSLLSATKVLLAAQCLERLSVFDISTVTVLIGVASNTEIQMTRKISKVVLHNQFNAANYANDIAIITLETPVILSRTVAPVCLPPASTDPNQYIDQNGAVIGWAEPNDAAGAAVPSRGVKQGQVTIAANGDCLGNTNFGQFVTTNNICITSDVFTCIGDIGGPVVIITSAPNVTPVTWTIVGINSFTQAACNAVGLKVRVSAYRAWIDTNMN